IAGDTSPVKAPSFSQYRSCALTPMFEPRAACATAWSAVNVGATTMSTPDTLLTALFRSSTKATASCTVLNIFQLPAIRGVLIGRVGQVGQVGRVGKAFTWPTRPTRPNARSCPFSKGGHSRKGASAEKFQG